MVKFNLTIKKWYKKKNAVDARTFPAAPTPTWLDQPQRWRRKASPHQTTPTKRSPTKEQLEMARMQKKSVERLSKSPKRKEKEEKPDWYREVPQMTGGTQEKLVDRLYTQSVKQLEHRRQQRISKTYTYLNHPLIFQAHKGQTPS
eukprot:NODE_6436_length_511_cov_5.601732_g5660_i0.p2 GENE.NODE_6436_length_511_cov_5.601732_g5660_i0~~NODE_6436_length_511_cov_5.601732_g5660_i0.p2  ORF type:complete len:145 (-),score=20.13 NODE_6436_length_511_cov_5.601732_g5660_i0:77-511(-)